MTRRAAAPAEDLLGKVILIKEEDDLARARRAARDQDRKPPQEGP